MMKIITNEAIVAFLAYIFHMISCFWIFSFLLSVFLTPALESPASAYEVIILGTIQDAGSPHIGCSRSCCSSLSSDEKEQRLVSSIGLIDHSTGRSWIFDATPDFPRQWELLESHGGDSLAGIFLTHAHIGHYTGLMYLGREALGSSGVSVYAMPRMKTFLENNGPWSQLVTLENIRLNPLQNGESVMLSKDLFVTPLVVPHRDEYSETVGYRIDGPERSILFIPDINKWELWDIPITGLISEVDLAFLDGSFYSPEEINFRPIEEIPHPTIQESMEQFEGLSADDKRKVYFIHFNHTNPVLLDDSEAFNSLSPFQRAMFLQREKL
jgi:pyrroloquinoline quinone biosynthesis protein B